MELIFHEIAVQKLIFSHFCNCKKKMNLVKKIIREIDLFDFMSFLAWTFLNFLARCALNYQPQASYVQSKVHSWLQMSPQQWQLFFQMKIEIQRVQWNLCGELEFVRMV